MTKLIGLVLLGFVLSACNSSEESILKKTCDQGNLEHCRMLIEIRYQESNEQNLRVIRRRCERNYEISCRFLKYHIVRVNENEDFLDQ